MPSPFFCMPSSFENHPPVLALLWFHPIAEASPAALAASSPKVTCEATFSACSSTVISNFAPSSAAQLSSPLNCFLHLAAAQNEGRLETGERGHRARPFPRVRRLRCSCCKSPCGRRQRADGFADLSDDRQVKCLSRVTPLDRSLCTRMRSVSKSPNSASTQPSHTTTDMR